MGRMPNMSQIGYTSKCMASIKRYDIRQKEISLEKLVFHPSIIRVGRGSLLVYSA